MADCVCERVSSEVSNGGGKTHPKCGRHHFLVWGPPGLNEKEKGRKGAEPQHSSLLPDCGCHVTSCLTALLLSSL